MTLLPFGVSFSGAGEAVQEARGADSNGQATVVKRSLRVPQLIGYTVVPFGSS